jgi:hypothetical protein
VIEFIIMRVGHDRDDYANDYVLDEKGVTDQMTDYALDERPSQFFVL